MTKKQIARIDKPDLLFDTLTAEVKSKKTGKALVVGKDDAPVPEPKESKEPKREEPRQPVVAKEPVF